MVTVYASSNHIKFDYNNGVSDGSILNLSITWAIVQHQEITKAACQLETWLKLVCQEAKSKIHVPASHNY